MEVEGNRPRGRPRKLWMYTRENNMRRCALLPVDTRTEAYPWCEMANPGKPGNVTPVGVFTINYVIKVCVCYFRCWQNTGIEKP
jgi:hypothetical protein